MFWNIFTFFFVKGKKKTNHRKKYMGSFFTYHFFSSYHIFSSASGYHPEEKCVTSYYLFLIPLKINLQSRWINGDLAHYKICIQVGWMHVIPQVTVTVSVTQELCQCGPKLSHISSILYCMKLRMKKNHGFQLSFIYIDVCFIPQCYSSEERISQCFPKKFWEQNCKHHRR